MIIACYGAFIKIELDQLIKAILYLSQGIQTNKDYKILLFQLLFHINSNICVA